MTALLDNLLAAVTGLVLVFVVGYGPVRWLLPAPLRPWFWLTVPLTGLTVAAVALGWLNIFLPVWQAAPLLLGFAVVAAISARSAPSIGPQAWREQATVAVTGLVGIAVALAPLWGRPDLVSIGQNWDIEIYLPMAQYLMDNPTGFGLAHPAGIPFPGNPNPLLWRVNFFDPRWSGLAFAQTQGVVSVLLGQGTFQNLPGLLALLHGLSALAVFLLARATFGLPFGLAALCAALLAVNPAALYVIFWSFGQQATSLPLVPWALTLAALAAYPREVEGSASPLLGCPSNQSSPPLRGSPSNQSSPPLRGSPSNQSSPPLRGRVREGGILLAGLALAALMASFIPAIPLYAVAVGLLALLVRRCMPRLLTVAALSALLAPWAYLRGAARLQHFWADRGFEGLTTGPDISHFPPLGWAFGLVPTPEDGLMGLLPADGAASVILSTGARLVIVGLITVGLVAAARSRNYPLLAFGGGCALLLLALRLFAPYPYGYLKLLAGSAGLLLALVLAAGWSLARWKTGLRLPLAAAGACLGVANLVGLAGHLPGAAERSPMAFREMQALGQTVPRDATVLLSGHPDYQGPKAGAVAYFLREAQLYGYVATGFSSFYRVAEDGIYDYALYHQNEPVYRELHRPGDLVWEGAGLRLYRFRPEAVYFRDLGHAGTAPVIERSAGQGSASGLRITEWMPEGYPKFEGWSPPGLGVLATTTQAETRYPELQHGDRVDLPLPLAAPSRRALQASALPVTAGAEELVIAIAAFREQEVTVRVGGEATTVAVHPGVRSYRIGPVRTPGSVEVSNPVESPVYLKSLALYADGGPPDEDAFRDSVLIRSEAHRAGSAIQLSIDYTGARYRPVLDVYSEDGQRHFGYWEFPLPRANTPRSYRLRFDAAARLLTLMPRQAPGARTLPGWRGDAGDGRYRALLALWEGERLVHTVPLFQFAMEQGRLTDLRAGGRRVSIG